MFIAAKQNQKFPFHFLSAPPTPPAEEKEMQGKFLVFAPATAGSGRGAQISCRQDYQQNTFELCLANTAKIRNQKKRTKLGRAEGATLMHSPRRIQNPKGFSTLRVGFRLPMQI